MKTSTFFLTLVSFLVSAVVAVPVASEFETDTYKTPGAEDDIEARSTDIGLSYCTAWGWGGSCHHGRYQYAVCYNVPSDFDDKISAIGPDEGQGSCNLYPDYDCKTASNPPGTLSVSYPGYGSLSGDVVDWNDVISSFICYP